MLYDDGIRDIKMNLVGRHVADRAMGLDSLQLFQAPLQFIECLHGQPLSSLVCHLHQHPQLSLPTPCGRRRYKPSVDDANVKFMSPHQ